MAIGLIVMNLAMIEDINIKFFQWINALAGKNPSLDYIAIFFAEGGLYIFIAVFLFLWFTVDDRSKTTSLLAAEASALGLLFNIAITLLYFHPRPFMMGLGTTLIYHGPETSFPSDHATVLFGASLYLLLFDSWMSTGVILFIVAILTAFAIVYSGIHFPFDMGGSLIIGMFSSFIIYRISPVLAPFNKWIVNFYNLLKEKIAIF